MEVAEQWRRPWLESDRSIVLTGNSCAALELGRQLCHVDRGGNRNDRVCCFGALGPGASLQQVQSTTSLLLCSGGGENSSLANEGRWCAQYREGRIEDAGSGSHYEHITAPLSVLLVDKIVN